MRTNRTNVVHELRLVLEKYGAKITAEEHAEQHPDSYNSDVRMTIQFEDATEDDIDLGCIITAKEHNGKQPQKYK